MFVLLINAILSWEATDNKDTVDMKNGAVTLPG